MTRFWTCSPVATRIGRDLAADARVAEHVVGARRLLDPPRLVHARAARIAAIASSTPQTWLASIISTPSGPSARRIRPARRSSESRSAPTFIFTWREARRQRLARRAPRPCRRRSRASPPTSCRPDSRRRRSRASRAAAPAPCIAQQVERLLRRQGILDVAEVDAADELLGREIARGASTAACPRAWPRDPRRR